MKLKRTFKKIFAVCAALSLVLTAVPMAAADFVAVTNITGVTTNAMAGTPLPLNWSVEPVNATNQTVVWTVANAGTTDATISGLTFSATSEGTATITATITNGSSEGVNYTQDFTITVNTPFVGVTDITGIPSNEAVGSFTLAGVVVPENATNKGITWSLVNAGATGATVSGNSLTTTSSGTVTIRATITNGLTSTTDFVKEYSITIGTQTITSASVQVPASETYGLRPTTATPPANSNFTVTSVAWRVGTTTFSGPSFLGNTRYSVDVTIAANPGFVFAEGSAFTGNINASRADIVRNTNDTITMSLEFPATRAAGVLPTAPRDFKAEPGNNQVRLTWTAPENNGGSNIVRYQLSFGKTEGYQRLWENIPNSGGGTVSYTVTGLENDIEYSFELRAVNQAYGGGISTPVIRSTPIGTATAPQNFRVSPGNGNVLVSWTPPSFSGGTVTGYEYSFMPAGNAPSGNTDTDEWVEVPNSGPSTISYLIPDLTNGVEYAFQVRAVNANGPGVATAKINGMPTVNALSAPRSFSATAGNEQVVLSWTSPANTGGNSITRYQYSQLTASGNPTWRDIPDSGAGTSSFTVPDLTNGTTYFFEIRAVAGNIQGATSGVRIATPAAPISNTTTSVDSRSSDIQTAANNNTGQNITINMAAGSNSISKAVLDSIRGKNVNLILDYGTIGRITINGNNINATNGAGTLNLNLQRVSGTNTMLADYSITKADIDAMAPLLVHQVKIGTGTAIAIDGILTVNLGDANVGRSAILCKFDTAKKEFEIVDFATIASNGSAAIDFKTTGDYAIIIVQNGDVNGDNSVGTDDALEILRAVAGITTLNAIQTHAAKAGRDGMITTNDALIILRRVAGLNEPGEIN
jgi:hypothetical protein